MRNEPSAPWHTGCHARLSAIAEALRATSKTRPQSEAVAV
jgi:hypothetical protein